VKPLPFPKIPTSLISKDLRPLRYEAYSLPLGLQSRLERAAMDIFRSVLILVRAVFGNRFVLGAENLARCQRGSIESCGNWIKVGASSQVD
jgi:hypothetical protein